MLVALLGSQGVAHMSRFLPKLGIISLVFASFGASFSQAYDVDQHFYGTYSMARYAGFSHEAAAKCAMYAQWPDETAFWSSPMFGPRIRRLIHFPCKEKANGLS